MIEKILKKERNHHVKKVLLFVLILLVLILSVWKFFLCQINLIEIFYNLYMLFAIFDFFTVILMCIFSFFYTNLNKFDQLSVSQEKISEYEKIKKTYNKSSLKG